MVVSEHLSLIYSHWVFSLGLFVFVCLRDKQFEKAIRFYFTEMSGSWQNCLLYLCSIRMFFFPVSRQLSGYFLTKLRCRLFNVPLDELCKSCKLFVPTRWHFFIFLLKVISFQLHLWVHKGKIFEHVNRLCCQHMFWHFLYRFDGYSIPQTAFNLIEDGIYCFFGLFQKFRTTFLWKHLF